MLPRQLQLYRVSNILAVDCVSEESAGIHSPSLGVFEAADFVRWCVEFVGCAVEKQLMRSLRMRVESCFYSGQDNLFVFL